jgi:hypothetical protein
MYDALVIGRDRAERGNVYLLMKLLFFWKEHLPSSNLHFRVRCRSIFDILGNSLILLNVMKVVNG